MANERMQMSFQMRLADALTTVQGKGSNLDFSPKDFQIDLNNNTSPLIDNVYAAVLTLTTGALTIDLTALVWNDTKLANLDLTGKKIYGYYILPLGANTMTFVEGASTGHTMFPATNGLVVGGGGSSPVMQYYEAGYAAVSASVKQIDVSGTGAETFLFAIGAGV